MKKESTKTFFLPDNCIYEYLVQLCNKSTRKPWKKNNDTTCSTKTFFDIWQLHLWVFSTSTRKPWKNIAITIFDPWQLHLWVFSHFFLFYLQTTLVCPYLILFCSLNLNLKVQRTYLKPNLAFRVLFLLKYYVKTVNDAYLHVY